ncbi:endonuclease/exonuclease/phosphatase family protein [Catenuloplanes atrovinosus]|uniref:Endonuclease/exonuclease/phosphatase family metal-dependent hydrolase n=1 Tax=Catenuloplanes atrovinosus TaxID=137266 RepID=A0AAE3YJW6_9ACTN|nr:endonuclease/exonuclease/phosphatase family protein [Catenuloplanes atrovinosus]MDR7273246.1 endonuclease/exonuclease/phosphatase family metal-dependent hydrolase [Catenuloplanes atrovinosus]
MSVDLSRKTSLLTTLCWVAAVPCAVWALVRALGLDYGPIIQLIAFTPYVTGGTLVVAALTLALRRWWAAGLAVLAAVALTAMVLPRALPDPDRGAGGGPALRVMATNVLGGGADLDALMELIRGHQVDVLAIQEFTPEVEAGLESRGLAAILPYRQLNPIFSAAGSALYSRYPMTDAGVREHPSEFTQAYGTLTVPGAVPVVAESVHPMAPWGAPVLDDWRVDLHNEPRATPDGPPRILLGDFNSTLDHSPLRDLIASGYRDAADATGKGLTGTWPYDGSPIPPVQLDHVLVDERIRVESMEILDLPGSDHRPVFAELSLPRAG